MKDGLSERLNEKLLSVIEPLENQMINWGITYPMNRFGNLFHPDLLTLEGYGRQA